MLELFLYPCFLFAYQLIHNVVHKLRKSFVFFLQFTDFLSTFLKCIDESFLIYFQVHTLQTKRRFEGRTQFVVRES